MWELHATESFLSLEGLLQDEKTNPTAYTRFKDNALVMAAFGGTLIYLKSVRNTSNLYSYSFKKA